MKKACFARGARKGFTLLEALFAVLLVAVLAAIAVPLYSNTRAQAQKDTCMSNIRAIANAESKYKFDTGAYTTTTGNLINNGLAEMPTCPLGDAYTVTIASGVCTIACGNAAHSATNKMTLQ